jgi:hypothetical protein
MLRRPITIVKEGVYLYGGRPVYKPWSEIQRAALAAKPFAITIEHPPIDENDILTAEDPIEFIKEHFPTYGMVSNHRANALTHAWEAVANIDDEKLIVDGYYSLVQKLKSGVSSAKGASLGFLHKPVVEKGEFQGREYWEKQTSYIPHHLALTEAPRVPYAMIHGNQDSTYVYTVDSVVLGSDTMTAEFRDIYQGFIKKHGFKAGKVRYYKFLNAYGFDDTKPMSAKVNQVAIRKMKAARAKKKANQ